MKKSFLAVLLTLFVIGCKHPLAIYGEGDIMSATGDRDCLLEQFNDPNDPACHENEVLPPDPYLETYYAQPRTGWHFHRWTRYCKDTPLNECEFDLTASTVQAGAGLTMPALGAIFREDTIVGYDSFYMGHSLFYPMTLGLPGHASTAGFTDHTQTTYFFPAIAGSPLYIWNNPTSKAAVQAVLDQGDVELFGMAIHHDELGIEGYRLWVDYALQQNPDTRFFIGIPWEWYPDTTTAAAYEASWQAYHPATVHSIIDQLRIEFPYSDFFCIPYGEAGVELYNLWDANNLPDVQALVLDPNNPTPSVFLDSRGHADSILVDLAELVFLNSIYGVDMTTYSHTPPYTTDLKAIADSIANGHDSNYNAPYLTP